MVCLTVALACSVAQEEAKTDAGGAFRIRGLKPGCKYQVSNALCARVEEQVELRHG
jgi:hypothetical protein